MGSPDFFLIFPECQASGVCLHPREGGTLHSQPPPFSPLSFPCMWLNLVCVSGLQRCRVQSASLLGQLGQHPLWEAR